MQGNTWRNLDKLNTHMIDMSGLGLSATHSPIATRTDIKHSKKEPVASRPRREKGPLDDLNHWHWADPDRAVDVLPQPFRFINDLIEDWLMRGVNAKIDEIDGLKSNPSYEGHVNRVQPSGALEIDGIVCLSQEETPLGFVLAGDSLGCIYLLDIVTKTKLTKFDTKEKKAVLEIKMKTVKYGDKLAIAFFVSYIGKYEVDCFLMFSYDLITVKKVFSFGKDHSKAAGTETGEKEKKGGVSALGVGGGAKKAVDPKRPEETEPATLAAEYLDLYPFVGEC
jgi:hypothetical protein